MAYEEILYEVEDRVLTITLNRPDKLNTFTNQMFKEIMDALDRADTDDGVRAIIFTGVGRCFCAGADLEGGADTWNQDAESGATFKFEAEGDTGGQLVRRIFDCHKPVIAAINGAAVGVGITMTLPMDIRVASNKAKLGFVFTARGIAPESCSGWFLPRIVGISQALEWTLMGNVFGAEEALRGGLVRSIHDPEDVLPEARRIAHHFAYNVSSTAVAITRHMMWKMLGSDHPIESHRIDTKAVFALGSANDAKEGIESFLEKRQANYTDSVSKDMPDFFPWWKKRTFEE